MKYWVRVICLCLGFAMASLEGAVNLETVLSRYIAAQGGEEAIEGVHSLRLEGIIEQEDQTFPFVQIKKVPNFMRTTLDLPQGEIIMGYDGQIGWMKSRAMEKSMLMDEAATAATAISAPLFSQLYALRDSPDRLRLLGEVDVDGEICYEIQARPENGNDTTFFITKDSFMERKVTTLETTKTGSLRTEIFYSNDHLIPPLTIPFSIRTYVNGQLRNTVNIEKATINPGVLSSYFAPSGGLMTPEEQQSIQHPAKHEDAPSTPVKSETGS